MKTPYLIINNDNDLLHSWYEENKNKLLIETYGIESNSKVRATNINLREYNSIFTCNIENRKFDVKVPIPGEHFILNSLCAALIGNKLKLTDKEIAKGIEKFELTKKRMEIIKLKSGIKIINDSYNASYESMKASIKSLSSMKQGRKIAVLGDMFELGEYAETLHRKVGEEVAKNNIDIVLCSGENSKFIIEEAQKLGMPKENLYYENTIDELYNKLKNILIENDNVLIKASNGMKFYTLTEKIIEHF